MVITSKIVQKERWWNYFGAFLPLILISLLSCGMSIYYLRCNPEQLLIFDDSYITLKFASNLFKYKGITYDGTSFLVGATSPLHIICVALCSLFLELEMASLVVGIVFFIFSSLLVYLWTLSIYEEKKIALLAGVLMSTSGWLVFDSLNGLETTTFIFFSLLVFYLFYAYENSVFFIFPLFLCVLTRPEGWFIASAIWIWQVVKYIMRRDKQTLRNFFISLGMFILLIIPYFLLYFYYTGSLLPNTALSKTIFFADVHFPSSRIWLLKDGLKFFYIKLLYPLPLIIFPLILFSKKVLLLPYLWFYFIIYYLFYLPFFPGALSHYWCRYQHIFIPLIIIAISGGTFELLKICKKKFLRITVFVIIASSIIYNQSVSLINVNKTFYSVEISYTKNLIDLAMWLRYNTPEDSLIALHDIGAVGYFSDRRILDLVGLTNPEVSRYYWDESSRRILRFDERRVIDYLREKKPDFLVMFPRWDKYFSFFRSDNKKYFKQIYVSRPLFPGKGRYNVYKCNWEL